MDSKIDTKLDPKLLEAQMAKIFAPLKQTEFDAPPFMKTRIMSRLQAPPAASKEIWLWRTIAGLATAACAVLLLMRNFAPSQTVAPEIPQHYAMQPYVIHVDLEGDKLPGARVAEVELPDGVHFVSKSHPEIAQVRKMRLNVPAAISGRSRLPFVVSSDKPGLAELKLKILDEKDLVVHERVLSIKFAQGEKKAETI